MREFCSILLPTLMILAGCDAGPQPPDYVGVYRVANVAPQDPPFGHIDAVFLDGVVPDAVDYDIMGGRLWRHTILAEGEIELTEEGRYRLHLRFERYEASEGADAGPLSSCERNEQGIYHAQGDVLTFDGLDSRDGRMALQRVGAGTLTVGGFRSTCQSLSNGTYSTSDFFLQEPVLVKQ